MTNPVIHPYGAIDTRLCPKRHPVTEDCLCKPCVVCGHGPHEEIHGAYYGKPPGTEPVGHQYKPRPTQQNNTGKQEYDKPEDDTE